MFIELEVSACEEEVVSCRVEVPYSEGEDAYQHWEPQAWEEVTSYQQEVVSLQAVGLAWVQDLSSEEASLGHPSQRLGLDLPIQVVPGSSWVLLAVLAPWARLDRRPPWWLLLQHAFPPMLAVPQHSWLQYCRHEGVAVQELSSFLALSHLVSSL